LLLRTAAILSVVLIGGMFGLRSAGYHLALSYVEQGVKETPPYARVFFVITAFFYSFWWILAPAVVGVLFTVALLTSQSRQRL
jgi:hypothetical protein